MTPNIILGPPGCGKTHRCIDLVKTALSAGVRPNKIAYLAFTRKAAAEAVQRASDELQLPPEDLTWFRTIHSFAFRQTNTDFRKLVKWQHYRDLAKLTGYEFKDIFSGDEDETAIQGAAPGDALLFLYNLARVSERSLQAVWDQRNNVRDDLTMRDLEKFAFVYQQFKKTEGLLDYTDVLEKFIESGFVIPFDLLVVDEAQDLSRVQWRCIEKLAPAAKAIYVAGDSDQAIHRWAGADVDYFLNLEGKSEVLSQSYRMPRKIHALATGLLPRIQKRRDQDFFPRDAEGEVNVLWDNSFVDANKGSWLFLARHGYQLRFLEQVCKENAWFYTIKGKASNQSETGIGIVAWETMRKGIPIPVEQAAIAARLAGFHQQYQIFAKQRDSSVAGWPGLKPAAERAPWFEALKRIEPEARDYFRSALRQGEKPISAPRITISTIHGAKGGEADGVYLLTDISQTTHGAMESNQDDETRVFYVGCTRARETLVIRAPQTQLYYPVV